VYYYAIIPTLYAENSIANTSTRTIIKRLSTYYHSFLIIYTITLIKITSYVSSYLPKLFLSSDNILTRANFTIGLFNIIIRTSIEPFVIIYIAKISPSLEKRRGKKNTILRKHHKRKRDPLFPLQLIRPDHEYSELQPHLDINSFHVYIHIYSDFPTARMIRLDYQHSEL
jgi:hypothetical protein